MKIKLLLLLLLVTACLAGIDLPQNTPVPPISVSLTGYVRFPGVYQLSSLNRLSDLITLEASLVSEAQQEVRLSEKVEVKPQQQLAPGVPTVEKPLTDDLAKMQAMRSIKLIRNGKTTLYDLMRFYRLGDLDQNPYLKDNDVVVISAIANFVTLSGGVNLPGEIEYSDGDKLAEMIELAKGFSFDADPTKLIVYRYKANRIDYDVINLNFTQNGRDFILQADDRLVILQDSEIRTRQRVTISGQVKNPGEYVIGRNSTLGDLINEAGGLTGRGDLKSLVYFSENLNAEPDPYLEVLMQRSMSDMTPLEYSYLRANLQQLKGKYSFDAAKFSASNGKEANPQLHDGDHVYIPEKLDMVWVSGQVRYPGLVPWVEGMDWDYYINAAGGYANTRKVGKGRLIRGGSGNWVKPSKNLPIMPGDTVFVPGQTDRSLWVDIKDIVTLTSSMITIIVGLRALTSK